jgi:hypothetical protein
MSVAKQLKNSLDKAKNHVLFQHSNADGWIAICKKEKNGVFRQYHYQPKELASALAEWTGENIYFSQNTFYKPSRKIENVRQLRSLFVDIDCYNLNYDPNWVAGKIRLELFGESIPEPNIIIYSGQGLVLVWLIEPVPYKALPLWTAVQNYLCNKLKYVGADSNALDPSRIFRVDGSINSKNNKEVAAEILHDYRYVLREIQEEYLPEITTKKNKNKTKGRPKKTTKLFNTYSLHHARLLDLVRLVELRNGDMPNMREIACFLYRYWSCCFIQDPQEALYQTLEFNDTLRYPLKSNEVIKATKSAEKAWESKNDGQANEVARSLGYPGAGYNLKNSTLIRWLKVTEEEQVHLLTIIGANEKRKRNTEQKRKKRDSVTREEYIRNEQQKTEDKLLQLHILMRKHPNANGKELAALMGVNPSTISRLKRQLYKNCRVVPLYYGGYPCF